MHDAPTDTANVLAPPPFLYGGALVAGLALQRAFPFAALPRRPARPLGLALIGLGLALGGSGFRAMRRAGTAVDPREPSTALVVSGPFRYTRNPLYLSLTLFYAGIAALA